jgi:hypothetical protein
MDCRVEEGVGTVQRGDEVKARTTGAKEEIAFCYTPQRTFVLGSLSLCNGWEPLSV